LIETWQKGGQPYSATSPIVFPAWDIFSGAVLQKVLDWDENTSAYCARQGKSSKALTPGLNVIKLFWNKLYHYRCNFNQNLEGICQLWFKLLLKSFMSLTLGLNIIKLF